MRKFIITLLIIMFVVILANEVSAIGVGVTGLAGDFEYEGDIWNYSGGPTFYLPMGYEFNDNFAVLLSSKGSYHSPNEYFSKLDGELEVENGHLIHLQILLNAKYNLRPNSSFQPYFKAGVGAYHFNGEIKFAKEADNISVLLTRPGAELGLGLGYEIVDDLRLSLEGNYNFINGEQYQGNGFSLIFNVKLRI